MKITQEWYAKKMIGAGDLFMQLNWTIDQGIGYQASLTIYRFWGGRRNSVRIKEE